MGSSCEAKWMIQESGTQARLRGVSVVSDQVAWASGAGGTVIATDDGGTTWKPRAVPDSAGLDFRDVEAVDPRTVYLLSIGEGQESRIYKTIDAGMTWTLLYTNRDPKGFLDAIAFWDADHGLALGDPVNGRYTILTTDDGGKTWVSTGEEGMPVSLAGEGAFAASGTCLVTLGDRHAWFGTGGGKTARVFRTEDRGRTWTAHETPLRAGTSTSGIFSVAFRDTDHGVIVGGSYDREKEAGQVAATSRDGGRTWSLATGQEPLGFRSAVAVLRRESKPLWIAMGPSGSDISTDDGRNWKTMGDQGFHAMDFAGVEAGWAVGEAGRVARIQAKDLAVLPSRTIELIYRATVKDIPKGAGTVDLWLPIPQTDRNQMIHRVSIDASQAETLQATRTESEASQGQLTHELRTLYFAEEPLVPLEGAVADLAEETTRGLSTDIEKARAIYDKVTTMMAYDKTGQGWGRGDALFACDAKRGNCTDFHALIIGIARSVKIPSRFAMGLPLSAGRGHGTIAGYHCWAELYVEGLGWVPVDSSEARKNPTKQDDYFGHHDENRLEFSRGRHLVTEPRQQGPPLNFFIEPYAEIDGKPLQVIDREFTFEDLPDRL